jgi:hypothetical protein
VQCYNIMVPYCVPNECIVWISLKTLRSPALASFADAKLLDFSPSDLAYNVLFIHEVIILLHTLYMVCIIIGNGGHVYTKCITLYWQSIV